MAPPARSSASSPRRRKPTPARRRKLLATEWGFWDSGVERVAGIDEAGRGPLAGPVVAAAVILPRDLWIDGVDDSKRLTPEKRRLLAFRIVECAEAYAVGAASPREVDRLNIRRATALAMQRAIRRLRIAPDHLLVDGLAVPELGEGTHTPLVGGDGRVHCIAAASILAKVTRDRIMRRAADDHPWWSFELNKGYPCPRHKTALRGVGPSAIHRRSWVFMDHLPWTGLPRLVPPAPLDPQQALF
jgi:ribonuclease HII